MVKAADSREERYAKNEAFFREVNERINRLSAGEPAPITVFTCECANVDCTEHFLVPPEEYEEVRSDPRRFFVTPGHLDLEVEEVVSERRDYWIVEKKGSAGGIAAERDPRS